MSEAFTQALQRGEQILDPQRWVWKAAFAILSGEMKRKRSDRSLDDLPEVVETDGPLALDLIRCLRELSDKQRASLVLFYYAGYSTAEVAAIIGSTAGAVRVHLSSAGLDSGR